MAEAKPRSGRVSVPTLIPLASLGYFPLRGKGKNRRRFCGLGTVFSPPSGRGGRAGGEVGEGLCLDPHPPRFARVLPPGSKDLGSEHSHDHRVALPAAAAKGGAADSAALVTEGVDHGHDQSGSGGTQWMT